jgi:hypothetical protein
MATALLKDESLILFKTISCFLYFYFNFKFFLQRYCKKIASFFVNVAILLQMSLEGIQYRLSPALESNQYSLAKNQMVGIGYPQTNLCYF